MSLLPFWGGILKNSGPKEGRFLQLDKDVFLSERRPEKC